MAVEFRTTRIQFDPTKGRTQRETGSVTFSRPVRSAAFAINGFNLSYTDGDHHVWQQQINIEETNRVISGANVTFPVSFLVRDSSGNIDDRFGGFVDVLVIADV